MEENQLREEMQMIRNKLNSIENKRKIEENKKYLGKFYKYRNKYGGDDPGWWLYLHITKTDTWCHGFQFQITSRQIIELDISLSPNVRNGYMEISKKEFDRAWRRFVGKVQSTYPLKK